MGYDQLGKKFLKESSVISQQFDTSYSNKVVKIPKLYIGRLEFLVDEQKLPEFTKKYLIKVYLH